MTANFAVAHGEPASDGTGQRTGRGTARERCASPGGAAHDRGAGDGTRDRVTVVSPVDFSQFHRRIIAKFYRCTIRYSLKVNNITRQCRSPTGRAPADLGPRSYRLPHERGNCTVRHLHPTRRHASASTSLIASTSITLPAGFADRDYYVNHLHVLRSCLETGTLGKTNTQQSARTISRRANNITMK